MRYYLKYLKWFFSHKMYLIFFGRKRELLSSDVQASTFWCETKSRKLLKNDATFSSDLRNKLRFFFTLWSSSKMYSVALTWSHAKWYFEFVMSIPCIMWTGSVIMSAATLKAGVYRMKPVITFVTIDRTNRPDVESVCAVVLSSRTTASVLVEFRTSVS